MKKGGIFNGMNIYLDSNKVYAGEWGSGITNAWLSGTVTVNTWHHVAVVYDSDGDFELFIDGTSQGTATPGGDMPEHTAQDALGAKLGDTYYHNGSSTGSGDYYGGQLDDVRVYERALTDGDITVLSNGSNDNTQSVNISTLTVNGNLNLIQGTFSAPATINIAGNFARTSGVYTHNSNTLNLVNAGVTSIISGDTTYNNFRSVTAAKPIQFTAGSTQTVVGTLTLTGTAGNLITLTSTVNDTAWNINAAAASVDYVSVRDSDASSGIKIDPGANSVSVSGNTNWGFNFAPTAPTILYVNTTSAGAGTNASDVNNLTDTTPVFSAIYNDSDDGDQANKSCIQVNEQADFSGINKWYSDGGSCDSGSSISDLNKGSRSSDIEYAGASLSCGQTYYWRKRFWDTGGKQGAWSSTQSFQINCTPTVSSGSGLADEDNNITGTLSHIDGDSDSVIYSVVSQPSNGTVTITNTSTGSYTYSPNSNYNGSDSFTFKVNDGTEDSGTETITLTVNSVNDAPTKVSNVADVFTNEDTDPADIALNNHFSDVDTGDNCTYSVVQQLDTNLGTVSIVNNKAKIALVDNANGTGNFILRCTDSGNASVDSNTVSIAVAAVNDKPVAVAGTNQNISEDATVITLDTTGTTDVDGDALTHQWTETLDTGPGCDISSFTIANPQFTFVNRESSYSCRYEYKVNDGIIDSDTDSVTFNVTADNDPTTIVDISDKTVSEGGELEFTVAGNDVDSDVDLDAEDSAENFAEIDVTMDTIFTDNNDGTGKFDWRPDGDSAGSYEVTFSATDGNTIEKEIVNITVVNVNTKPIFAGELPNIAFIAGTVTAEVFDLDDYFSDADSETLTYLVSGNNSVEVIVEAGLVTMSAPTSFDGTEEIIFTAVDGEGLTIGSNIVVVTVSKAQEGEQLTEDIEIDEISHIDGSARGKGIVTIYDKSGNELTKFQAFPKGGVIPKIATLKNNQSYIFTIKKRPGTTTRVFNLQGKLVRKKRISPNVHWRKLAVGKLDKNKNTEEIVVATARGRTVYFKIYTYRPNRKKFNLIKRSYFRADHGTQEKQIIRKVNFRVSVENKRVVLRNKKGKRFLRWKPF